VAAFASQDVVGPAGGLRVHGFDADPLLNQRPEPGGLREPNALAAAKDDKFRAKIRQLCKMGDAKSRRLGDRDKIFKYKF
jgi:hypothetical protein